MVTHWASCSFIPSLFHQTNQPIKECRGTWPRKPDSSCPLLLRSNNPKFLPRTCWQENLVPSWDPLSAVSIGQLQTACHFTDRLPPQPKKILGLLLPFSSFIYNSAEMIFPCYCQLSLPKQPIYTWLCILSYCVFWLKFSWRNIFELYSYLFSWLLCSRGNLAVECTTISGLYRTFKKERSSSLYTLDNHIFGNKEYIYLVCVSIYAYE